MAKALVCRIKVRTTVLRVVQLEWVWLLLLEHIQGCLIPMDSSYGSLISFGHAGLMLGWYLCLA